MRIDWEAVADLLASVLNPRLPEGTKLEARGTLLLFNDGLEWLTSNEIGLSHSEGIEDSRLESEIDGLLTSLQDVIAESPGTLGTAWPDDPDYDDPLPEAWVHVKDGALSFGYGTLCFYGPTPVAHLWISSDG